MDLTILKDVVTIGAPVVAVVGFGFNVRAAIRELSSTTALRLERVEKILLNGGSGLIQRVERVEQSEAVRAALCEVRHGGGTS